MKITDVTLVYKKNDLNLANNYWTVNIRHSVSKSFEIFKNICRITLIIFYPSEDFSSYYPLLFIEKWKITRENMPELFSWTFLKHVIQYTGSFYVLNCMNMDSLKRLKVIA